MDDKIAVIGMGCIFPGAKNPDELWQNLLKNLDMSSDLSEEHIGQDISNYIDNEYGKPDKLNYIRNCYVDDMNLHFDFSSYKIPKEELEALDDIYLWSMYAAKQALEDGGYFRKNEILKKCGLLLADFISPSYKGKKCFIPLYNKILEPYIAKLLDNPGFKFIDAYEKTSKNSMYNANTSGLISAITAQAIGIEGPYFSLDSACSSSIYAIKLSSYYLLSGQADLMLAGAVCKPDYASIASGFNILRALPEEGESVPLDESSQGLKIGEGSGYLLLKRLNDAIRDNDSIYCIIEGIGLSNDGSGKHILVPNIKGQVTALERAYKELPKDIDYVELHATGTKIGDSVELQAIEKFFGKNDHLPYIGANKANVGHLLTASGMVSIFKVILSMKNAQIPATIKIKNPLLKDNLFIKNGRLVTENKKWDTSVRFGNTKIAGVNAFGFGGSNAHIVLKEYIENQHNFEFEKVDKVNNKKNLNFEPVAVSGMYAAFGMIDGIYAINSYIYDCKQFYIPLPKTRWGGIERRLDILQEIGIEPDNVPWGAYVEKVYFDCIKYKIPPNMLDFTLAGHAFMLRAAEKALIDAGFEKDGVPRNVAVIIAYEINFTGYRFNERVEMTWMLRKSIEKSGIMLDQEKMEILENIVKEGVFVSAGMETIASGISNIVASRVASDWNFNGPAFCVSSMENSVYKAIEIARFMLTFGEVEAVVVGALENTGSFEFVLWQNMISKNNTGKKSIGFDKDSNGWDIGEGGGAIVLKRYKDVKDSGEKLYSIINHIKILNENKFENIKYIPSSDAVYVNCVECFKESGIKPEQIGYLEVSASGIAEEDEAEIKGITKAYCSKENKKSCIVGSIKSNFGHTFAASGIGSVIRASLCLNNRYLPGTPNLGELKLQELWDNSVLKVAKETKNWEKPISLSKRMAAINSLGMDRSYVHLFLEEPDEDERKIISDDSILNENFKYLKELYVGRERGFEEIILSKENIQLYHNLDDEYRQKADSSFNNPIYYKQKLTEIMDNSQLQLMYDKLAGEMYNKLNEILITGENKRNEEVLLNYEQLVELTDGKISNIFGRDFEEIDNLPIRTRMPSPPFMFVSRVLNMTSPKGKLEPSVIEWEYDIPQDAWFTRDDYVTSMVPLESSHALLVALSYMGCDHRFKGKLKFRAIGAKITMLGKWCKPGDTIRGVLEFTKFVESGKNLLVYYKYDCYVKNEKMFVAEAISGFFSNEVIEKQKGIKRDETFIKSQVKDKCFKPILKCAKKYFNENDIENIQKGRFKEGFGEDYDDIEPVALYPDKMKMLDRVTCVNSEGGRWGLGEIIGEVDIHPDHWAYNCHFKNDPVFPGTLLSQGVEQLILFYSYFLGINSIKKLKIVPAYKQTVSYSFRGEIHKDKTYTIVFHAEVKDIYVEKCDYTGEIKKLKLVFDNEIIREGIVICQMKDLVVYYQEEN